MFNVLMKYEFDQSLPMVLLRTLDSVMPHFRRIFSDYDITEQQWRILRVLWEGKSSNLKELSKHTLILEPSMVGVIGRLEKRGLVTRYRDTENRRSVRIEVTAKGDVLYREVEPKINLIYSAIMDGISDEQWRNTHQILALMTDHAKQLRSN